MSNSSQPHGLQPTRLLLPWDFPGKSTGAGCHCLLHRAVAVTTTSSLCISCQTTSSHGNEEGLMITAKEYVLLQKRNCEHRQFQVFFLVFQREVLCLFPKVISYTDIPEKSLEKRAATVLLARQAET